MVEEVAMMPATERLPEMRASPWTERSFPGVVVPMPTLPPLVAKYALPLEVIAVVLAYGNTLAIDEVAK